MVDGNGAKRWMATGSNEWGRQRQGNTCPGCLGVRGDVFRSFVSGFEETEEMVGKGGKGD